MTLVRRPRRIRYSGVKTVAIRVTTTKAANANTQTTRLPVGSGICIPIAEKQGHEKVAQADHLRGDIERIGKGGERHPCDQRAHLTREVQSLAKFANKKTPCDRTDLHQFRHASDTAKDSRQDVTAHSKRRRYQNGHAYEREEQNAGSEVFKIRLDCEKENDRQVLEHEHTQRDASGQSVELLLVVEHFDDDDRAAERTGNGEIKRVPLPGPEGEPAKAEKNDAERNSTEDLHQCRESNGTTGTGDFLQVDLQPDHE